MSRMAGPLVFVGLVKAPIRFNDPEFHRREMTLLASRNATREDFDKVMAAITAGDVAIPPLITHRTALDRGARDLPPGRGPHRPHQGDGGGVLR